MSLANTPHDGTSPMLAPTVVQEEAIVDNPETVIVAEAVADANASTTDASEPRAEGEEPRKRRRRRGGRGRGKGNGGEASGENVPEPVSAD